MKGEGDKGEPLFLETPSRLGGPLPVPFLYPHPQARFDEPCGQEEKGQWVPRVGQGGWLSNPVTGRPCPLATPSSFPVQLFFLWPPQSYSFLFLFFLPLPMSHCLNCLLCSCLQFCFYFFQDWFSEVCVALAIPELAL